MSTDPVARRVESRRPSRRCSHRVSTYPAGSAPPRGSPATTPNTTTNLTGGFELDATDQWYVGHAAQQARRRGTTTATTTRSRPAPRMAASAFKPPRSGLPTPADVWTVGTTRRRARGDRLLERTLPNAARPRRQPVTLDQPNAPERPRPSPTSTASARPRSGRRHDDRHRQSGGHLVMHRATATPQRRWTLAATLFHSTAAIGRLGVRRDARVGRRHSKCPSQGRDLVATPAPWTPAVTYPIAGHG